MESLLVVPHSFRSQRTLRRPAVVHGHGLFGGADVTLRFLPADENHGIVFERVDLAAPVRIPATIASLVKMPRRTAIASGGASVQMIEHVMAALAGLQVDNCLVQLDAPEPPGGDGSALFLADALWEAGFESQSAPRSIHAVQQSVVVEERSGSRISVAPTRDGSYRVSYSLDYGACAIPPQSFDVVLTPESFIEQVAFARTFILEEEVKFLQAQGIGLRATPQSLLVFGPGGVIDNRLRAPDECARHKVLDCIGDFALIGSGLSGDFRADRSGHHANHEVVRQLLRGAADSATAAA
ncbi:UDP-3-O-acyl-N-acetylglucosamine deacetylase [Planctomyces sp. SH-PL14]|uniref:UDP-3-O-acyl-N-acetylglucosamine deacetylase n=1 Tax=Planctomyces sp. SH-PL14 TaxID=1632864 RepID=UPI00078C0B6C|nr:UDP-3-O-acyl-N-acetylglucosamine deacetylase [Planctomyces sp. SH-PL14]AMV17970.1 UDP-3-O-[3-hydroxymyristoyl] N-acetylglucosamine deacetylase [Planctomyces sp. SH-PL14]